ncbi:hypothetical protein SKAU_G00271400 [Synaphobranchus kaupii]|uniref:Uncharacterized protein n=1 Tax=Synaphobranchus kaupii TaxID=118154 RepID=A0A9Q1F0P7_SYNKA|nr:hypothetical protein SKAU_G00271400 [Synaphobranchus kaupii]
MRKCPCPVPACCFRGQKLDRHLARSHVELTQKRCQAYSHRAKREEAIAQLGQLRASNPAVPMVSQLDLQASEGGSAEREVAEDGGCQNPACDRQRQDLEDKVSRLEKELRALRRRFRRYVCRRVVPQVAAEVQAEAGPSTVGQKRSRAEEEEEADEAGGPEREEAAEMEEEPENHELLTMSRKVVLHQLAVKASKVKDGGQGHTE